MNKELIYELYEEYDNIKAGKYLTEEQFEKEHKVKIH